MLQHLSVENYALIRKLDLSFERGFTAITGETGAGKSILLGALSLILGNRADTSALYDSQKKCVVEGRFNIKNYGLHSFFEKHDLDYEQELILRREINSSGKSRAFINDTPVRLPQMKELGARLVDIHSQNKTLTLNDSNVQLAVIDSVAVDSPDLNYYRNEFRQLKALQKKYSELDEQEKQSKADIDYYQYLFNELQESNLSEEEQEEAEAELDTQNHSESIKSSLSKGSYALTEEENSIIEQLKLIHADASDASLHHQPLQELSERLNSAIIELEDISSEMQSLSEDISYNPERIEELNNRLNIIYELQQKHRVNTVNELLEKMQELQEKLDSVSGLEMELEHLKRNITEKENHLHKIADQISEKRKQEIPRVEQEVMNTLKQLGMADAIFKVRHQKTEEIGLHGKDEITFTFSANKGVPPQPIEKIASGGELSRLMLSVKSLIASKTMLPTVIFDEIDSGVSGDIAGKTGNIMKKMSQNIQVIAITHLPQIAGKSDDHLFAYKEVENGKTYSHLKKLLHGQRVEELAKMLSDNKVTEAALATAKQLMKSN